MSETNNGGGFPTRNASDPRITSRASQDAMDDSSSSRLRREEVGARSSLKPPARKKSSTTGDTRPGETKTATTESYDNSFQPSQMPTFPDSKGLSNKEMEDAKLKEKERRSVAVAAAATTVASVALENEPREVPWALSNESIASSNMDQELLDAKLKKQGMKKKKAKAASASTGTDPQRDGLIVAVDEEAGNHGALKSQSDDMSPGAVAVPGIGGGSRVSDENVFSRPPLDLEEEEEEEEDKLSEKGPSSSSDTRLVSAFLVEPSEDETTVPTATATRDVPIAEATTLVDEPPARNKRLVYMLGLVAVLLVAAIVVVVVVLVTGGGSSGGDNANDEVDVTVVLRLDDNPQETGWSIQCDSDTTIESVPATTYAGLNSRLVTEDVQVPVGKECQFTITDTGGDGIAGGSFQVYNGNDINNVDAILVDGTGDFADARVVSFQADFAFTEAPTVSPAPTLSMEPTSSQGTSVIMVEIQLDQFPAEIGWSLQCANTEIVSVPTKTYSIPSLLVSETFEVDNGAGCEFMIEDDYGDGINQGFYRLYFGTTRNIILAEGGDFEFQENVLFVVAPPEPTISPAPTTRVPTRRPITQESRSPRPTVPPGNACETNADCGGGVCVNGNCVPTLVPNLGICDSDSDCQSSVCAVETFSPQASLVCCPSGEIRISSTSIPWSSASLFFCQLQQTEGQACVHNNLCQSSHCVNGACTATIVSNLGACDDDSDCQSNVCAFNTFSQTAELACCPTGEQFVSSTDIPWSSSSLNFCQRQVPAGEPCPRNNLCQSGQCVNGACVASIVGDLGNCDDDSDCSSSQCGFGNFSEAAELVCCPNGEQFISASDIPWSSSSLNFCQRQQPVNEPCPRNNLCESGQCVNGRCAESIASELGPCDDDSDCSSNQCGFGNFSEAAERVCCPNGEQFISSSVIPWSSSSLTFCQRQQPANEPCPRNNLCQSGQCVNGACVAGIVADLGKCDDDTDCSSNQCGYGNFSEVAELVCCPNGEQLISASDIPWSSSSLNFCQRQQPVNEPCPRNNLCQSGQCVNGRCAESVASELEPCDDDSDCATSQCGYGNFSEAAELVCCPDGEQSIFASSIPWSSSSLTFCQRQQPVNEPCPRNNLCQSGQCVNGRCAESVASELEPCDDDSDCSTSQCGYGNFSEAAELVCCPNGEQFLSASDIPWSSSSLNFCQRQQPVNEPCPRNSLCQSGQCVNGRCAESVASELEPCDDDSDCATSQCGYGNFSEAAELVCCPDGEQFLSSSDIPWSSSSLNFCQRQQPVNEPCPRNNLCQSGQCVNGACVASIVGDLGKCDDDSDCSSAQCGYGNFSEAAELVCCPNGEQFISASDIPWSSSSLNFCQRQQPANEPCPRNSLCQSGQCVNGACVAGKVGDLGKCDDDSDCSSNQCGFGNFSEAAERVCCPNGEQSIFASSIPWSSSSLNFCQRQQPVNEPCPRNNLCQSGQCVNGACVASIVGDLGKCDDDSDCSSNQCGYGNFSEAAELVCCPNGEQFISSSDIPWSSSSLTFCQRQQPVNEPCPRNNLCQSGHCVNGACVGSAVANFGSCDDDSDCLLNTCAFEKFSAAAELVCCPSGDVFVSSTSIPWSSSSLSFCQSQQLSGEPCTTNSLCQSGSCVDGTCL